MNNRLFAPSKELEKYFLCDWISSIYHFEFDEKKIDPRDTVAAFQAMLIKNDISDVSKQLYKAKGTWDNINKVREILYHPNLKEKLNLTMGQNKIISLSNEEIIAELQDLISEKINVITSRQLNTNTVHK